MPLNEIVIVQLCKNPMTALFTQRLGLSDSDKCAVSFRPPNDVPL